MLQQLADPVINSFEFIAICHLTIPWFWSLIWKQGDYSNTGLTKKRTSL